MGRGQDEGKKSDQRWFHIYINIFCTCYPFARGQFSESVPFFGVRPAKGSTSSVSWNECNKLMKKVVEFLERNKWQVLLQASRDFYVKYLDKDRGMLPTRWFCM